MWPAEGVYMYAVAAKTGKQLWASVCRESYNSPPDVLVADGLVWAGSLTTKKDPGITQGLDVKTGKNTDYVYSWSPGIDMATSPEAIYSLTANGIHAIDREKYTSATLTTKAIDEDTRYLERTLKELGKNAEKNKEEIEEKTAKLNKLSGMKKQLRQSPCGLVLTTLPTASNPLMYHEPSWTDTSSQTLTDLPLLMIILIAITPRI